MSLWDETPTSLTSFTPISSEVQSSGNFLSRLFKRGKDDSDQSTDSGSIPSSREVSVERSISRDPSIDPGDNGRGQETRGGDVRDQSGDQPGIKQGPTTLNTDNRGSSSPSLEGGKTDSGDSSKRTLSSVITRLAAILDRRTPTPQVYRDSDFKQYWMPDSSCRECYDCGDKFTTFRRRHHCRICGQIFCNGCCNEELSGKIIGYKGSIRVCTYCFHIVQQYAKKADPAGEPKVTTEVLHKYLDPDGSTPAEQGGKGQRRSTLDLQGHLNLRSPGDPDVSQDGVAPFDLTPKSEFVVMDNFPSERRLLIQESLQLRNLWTLMNDSGKKGVEFQCYRIKLRTYQRCIAGNKLVDWLLKQDKVANRAQAVAIGQALIDANYLDPLMNIATPFQDDFTLYKPTESNVPEVTPIDADKSEDTISEDSAPLWFQQIQANSQDNINIDGTMPGEMATVSSDFSTGDLSQDSLGRVKVDERHFDEPLHQGGEDTDPIFGDVVREPTVSGVEGTSNTTWRTLNIVSDDAEEKETFDKLQQENHEHLTVLTKQLLSEDNLPVGWADIIISTVDRVSLFVKPDVKNSSDDMDIRNYVHIKKIPGGKREQTSLVHGVIFTKNIAHKKMAQNLNNPGVLLLYGSIEYQRVENKLSSLQPQILQEEEFLRKSIAKIAALKAKPDVLVVEKSVSRLAQDFLLKHGIILIYNVKLSVMQRLSRFLQTDIIQSIDSLVRAPTLGFCHSFSVRSFQLPSGDSKTLLCFDGCATHLGCAITLRGGSTAELKRVKRITQFMIYASYHSRLEISFCMDEFLMAPAKDTVDFDLDKPEPGNATDTIEMDPSRKDGTEVVPREGKEGHDAAARGDVKLFENVTGKPTSLMTSPDQNRIMDWMDSGERELLENEKDAKNLQQKTLKDDVSVDSNTEKDVKKLDLVQTDIRDHVVDSNNGIGRGNGAYEASNEMHVRENGSDGVVQSVGYDSGQAAMMGNKVCEDEVTTKPSQTQVCDTVYRESGDNVHRKGKDRKVEDNVHTIGKDTAELICNELVEHDKRNNISDDDLVVTAGSIELNHEKTERIPSFVPVGTGQSDVIQNVGTDQSNVIQNEANQEIGEAETDIYTGAPVKFELTIPEDSGDNVELGTGKECYDSQSDSRTGSFISQSLNSSRNSLSGVKSCHESSAEESEVKKSSNLLDAGCDHRVVLRGKNDSPQGQKSPSVNRKSETTQLTDKSDPLHNYQINHDESIFQSSLAFQEQIQTHRFKFRKALDNVVLSASPYIKYDLPYLETEAGAKCELRRFFQEEIYWSSHFSLKTGQSKPRRKYDDVMEGKKADAPSNIQIVEAHDFIRCQLHHSIDHNSTQFMLAKFRAYGGRIKVCDTDHMEKVPEQNQSGKGKSLPVDTVKGDNMSKENVCVWERKIDCLDPFRHQRIALLFSSFSYASENHPSPCVYPWIVTMDFYGRNDITLGGFLERFCFRPSYTCPSGSCSTSMVKHIRRFVHGQGSISVVLKRLEKPIANGQEHILIWSWCHRCKQVTPVVPMSTDTWNMSFAKYLEMRFHGKAFQRRASVELCKHSLHHDHFQYFGFKDTVASFKFSPVKIKEIKLPPFVISTDSSVEIIHLYRIRDEVKRLVAKMMEVYTTVLDWMTRIKAESSCEKLGQTVSDYILMEQKEKSRMRELAHSVRERLNTLLKSDDKKILALNQDQLHLYWDAEDGFVMLKRGMMDSINAWNNRLQELFIQQKKVKTTGNSGKKDKDTVSAAASLASAASLVSTDEREEVRLPDRDTRVPDREIRVPDRETRVPDRDTMIPDREARIMDRESKVPDRETKSTPSSLSRASEIDLPLTVPLPMDDGLSVSGSDLDCFDSRRKSDFSIINMSPPALRAVTSACSLDSYTYGVTPGIHAVWPSSYSVDSDSYVICHTQQAVTEETDDLIGSMESERTDVVMSTSLPDKELQTIAETTDDHSLPPTIVKTTDHHSLPQTIAKTTDDHSLPQSTEKLQVVENVTHKGSGEESQTDGSAGDKIGALKKSLINTIWQGSGAYQLQIPFDPCEHYILPPCKRLPVVVYDHEPSSIIAYSLSCHDYFEKLHELQKSQRLSKLEGDGTDKMTGDGVSSPGMVKRPSSGKLSFFKGSGKEVVQPRQEVLDSVRYVPKPDNGPLESPIDETEYPVFTTSTQETSDKSKLGKQATNSHIELQFSDSTARFYCKVYFVEQFRKLRKLIFPEGDDVYARSLSRCKPWEAKGGKSGSSFCKTDDDRFILKQMSSMEVESFEKFGPQYFQYISETAKQQKPTALAKIVGVYRIGFRNQMTNHAMKQDLLVMENLFYNRNISQTFDLKGSERNRLVKDKRKRDEELVLLDENFLRVSVDCPLYILSHSKTMLMLAISHDSQFLSTNLVMDYSLLVGVDQVNKELVIGIIDYIRTFTWDKKLETILKSNFGGQGKMPTVVSPELYRNRFLDAMGKYFLSVPDQWSGLGRDIDS